MRRLQFTTKLADGAHHGLGVSPKFRQFIFCARRVTFDHNSRNQTVVLQRFQPVRKRRRTEPGHRVDEILEPVRAIQNEVAQDQQTPFVAQNLCDGLDRALWARVDVHARNLGLGKGFDNAFTTYYIFCSDSFLEIVMTPPDYVTLAILATCLFLTATLATMVTYGLMTAGLTAHARQKSARQFSAYALAWLTFVLVVSYSNVVIPTDDQPVPILGILVIGSTVLGTALLTRSAFARQVVNAIPLHWLATVQIYRVIGILFLVLQSDGLLSAYFAASTGWGDILVGVTAPLVGYLLFRDAVKYRFVGIAWCVAGITDLLLVLYKGLTSAPGPLQTAAFDLPTVVIAYFPFPIIPLLIVPISIILHVQLIRRLSHLTEPKLSLGAVG